MKNIFCHELITVILLLAGTVTASENIGSKKDNQSLRDPFENVSAAEIQIDITPENQLTIADVQQIPERHLESIMLKFLRVENVLPVINKMLTEFGAVSVDAESNTIIICDTRENLDRITAEIRKADKTPKQVLIEVVIVDVQLSNETELGVNWDNLFKSGDGDLLGNVSYSQNLSSLTTGGSLTLINGRVESTIKALQKIRDTEILASPRVLVLSGQTANLKTIEEIPYTDLTQTGAGGGIDNPIASTKFKEAGITLKVKPTITDDREILLLVEPTQSVNTGVAGLGNTDVPIIDQRYVQTTLLMSHGQIMVIGGLRSKDVRVSNDKIPLLGDLPFIGGLFSKDRDVVEHSELLIMIAPHIIDDSIDLKNDELERWNQSKGLEPLKLKKIERPEYKFIDKITPQNKPEEK